jgi:hypothetical protein
MCVSAWYWAHIAGTNLKKQRGFVNGRGNELLLTKKRRTTQCTESWHTETWTPVAHIAETFITNTACNAFAWGTSNPLAVKIFSMCVLRISVNYWGYRNVLLEANHIQRVQYIVPCILLNAKYSYTYLKKECSHVRAAYCHRPLENWDKRTPFEEWMSKCLCCADLFMRRRCDAESLANGNLNVQIICGFRINSILDDLMRENLAYLETAAVCIMYPTCKENQAFKHFLNMKPEVIYEVSVQMVSQVQSLITSLT